MANNAPAPNVLTLDSNALKTHILKTVESYKGANKAFVNLFIALCERFSGDVDNQSGDMLQHFLLQLDDEHKTVRNRVIGRLREWSKDTLVIEYDAEQKKWSVLTKRDSNKRSLFEKDFFVARVAEAKKTTNALTYTPDAEPKQAKPKKFNPAKAETKASESLKILATGLMESDKTLTPEKLAIKLRAIIDLIIVDVKPTIEGEKA